jgi:hypothetical protein
VFQADEEGAFLYWGGGEGVAIATPRAVLATVLVLGPRTLTRYGSLRWSPIECSES